MGKILAIIFLAVFAWYALPIMARGIWVSPTLYPSSWWGEPIYDYSTEVAKYGYGWFNFDPRNSDISGQTTANIFNSL